MDKQEARERLKTEMMKRPGRSRIVGMGELFELVFQQGWENRINDTRALRKLVDELQREGVPICAENDGYYLASCASELEAYCRRIRGRAMRILVKEAKMRKLTLPDLLGQLRLALVSERR